MSGSAGPKAGRSARNARLLGMRRLVAITVLTLLTLLVAGIAVWQTRIPVRLFEDWRWYGDGPARLMTNQQLYDPVLLGGPYDQADPAVIGNFNQWSALAVALVPFATVIPEPQREPVWGALMATMLVLAFALVWPRNASPMTNIALVLVLAAAPPFWLALRTANLACAVALGVALTIVGQRRRSFGLVAAGLLLAGIAKLIPAVPLVLWLIVRHREWRPVVAAVLVGMALTAIAVLLQGLSVITDFVIASAGQLPLAEWTNVAPAYLLAPLIGNLALPLSMATAVVLAVAAVRPNMSDGASLLLLAAASCLVLSTTHVFWWLSPIIVALAFYGDWITRRMALLFDWRGAAST